ncbi:MAG: hypothetical protein J7M12_05825 [Candidatus Hydrogenedentes bacterium]|nr:hypothetical protein [Candidatus Hydrogenedentota bacterium]
MGTVKSSVAACCVAVALAACSCAVSAATYYVDSVDGNDSNAGTSQTAPWQTLDKVNATTFEPGDRILFRRGRSWFGKLNPKGSGTPANPIEINTYRNGPKPLIDGGGSTGDGVLYFHNQEYWEANHLELTNDATDEGDRRGVLISASNFGVVDHIYLKELDIHDIKGIAGQSISAKDTGGIGIKLLDDDLVDTRFNDILIEGCTISRVDNTGIYSRSAAGGANTPGSANFARRKITNLYIRGNQINDIAKNAMIIRMTDNTCVVEHNVCWDTCMRVNTGNTIFGRSVDGTVFQYNEGYLNHSTGGYDGSLYDADLECYNATFQYSYSHDNAHGLIWFASKPDDTGTTVRYNISQNDHGIIFALRSTFVHASFYNNVVYIPEHLSPEIIQERDGRTFEYEFYNNIIYNLSPTATYTFNDGTRDIDSNIFFGVHPANEPADANKITSDPMFVEPGSGGIGLDTLDGYMLQPGSPAIDSGRTVAGAPPVDFWGNPVPLDDRVDRGVNEFQAPPGTPLAGSAASSLLCILIVITALSTGSRRNHNA